MFTKSAIEKYFEAEKRESLLFMAIGIAAMITAIIFFGVLKLNFYRGAAVPLGFLGLMLAVVGYPVCQRSDEDRRRIVYAYDMNPSQLKTKEWLRMKTVMRNFVVYRYPEIFLFLAGSGLSIYFIRDFSNDFWRGLGLALSVMALVSLTADFFAERRGRVYIRGPESFIRDMPS